MTEQSSESHRCTNLVSKLQHPVVQEKDETGCVNNTGPGRTMLKPNKNAKTSMNQEPTGEEEGTSEQILGIEDENSYMDGLGYNYSHVRNNSTINSSVAKNA